LWVLLYDLVQLYHCKNSSLYHHHFSSMNQIGLLLGMRGILLWEISLENTIISIPWQVSSWRSIVS
jgi:hypothetical protein